MIKNDIKICHFSSRHSVNDVRIYWKECRSLAKAGYNVTLIAIGDSCVSDGVSIIGVNEPGSRLSRLTKTRRTVYEAALEVDADVYHFHDPELLPYGKKLARMGKSVIFDSHEIYVKQFEVRDYIPSYLKMPLSKVYDKYESTVCMCLDAVIVPTTVNSNNPFEGKSKRTVIVDNLPLLPDFEIKQNDELGDKVCYIGSITSSRGVGNLIDACHLANKKLIICGSISEDYHAFLQSRESYSCVDYRGVVPFDSIGEVMQECFAGMATLLRSGQWEFVDNIPTKVYDCMLNYLPVVVNDSEKSKELIRNERCGLYVNTDDVVEIAAAISWLDENRQEAKLMGARGHRAVIERLNWQAEESKLLELYDSIQTGSIE